jgi:hypothetical protein
MKVLPEAFSAHYILDIYVFFTWIIPDEGYSRNSPCALNYVILLLSTPEGTVLL